MPVQTRTQNVETAMHSQKDSPQRLHLMVRGAVQGVGFRPFVFRLAREHQLAGWIQNSPQGVHIEVEGSAKGLELFLGEFERNPLPAGSIHSIEQTQLDMAGYAGFEIRPSSDGGAPAAL